MLRKLAVGLVLFLLPAPFFFLGFSLGKKSVGPQALGKIKEVVGHRPLDKFTFPNLKERSYTGSRIVLDRVLATGKNYTSHLFYFDVEGKKVSGQANLPKAKTAAQKFPVVVMFRGYVDQEKYRTGDGTRKAAAVFAQNGFLTLAPDFLGYGESDEADPDRLKARFETYAAALNLISSIPTLPQARSDQLFLWGHSNGGQIALTVLEITDRDMPTTLWAPVSKPFPYSVLFYSDEASDSGKMLRRAIAQFEQLYDVENFSLTIYLDWVAAPVQIHQGSLDDQVPIRWSEELVKKLRDKEKQVDYFVYAGEDHNFAGGSWNKVVSRDLNFFKKFLMSND